MTAHNPLSPRPRRTTAWALALAVGGVLGPKPGIAATLRDDVVAILPVDAPQLSNVTARTLNEQLAEALDALSNYEIVSPSDTESILGDPGTLEAQRCDPVTCTRATALLLGSRYLLRTRVEKSETATILMAQQLDAKAALAIVASATLPLGDDEVAYEETVRRLVRILLNLEAEPPAGTPPTVATGGPSIPTPAWTDDEVVTKLRQGFDHPTLSGSTLSAERQTTLATLLDTALISPDASRAFVRERLLTGPDDEQIQLLFAFLLRRDPGLQGQVAQMAPLLVMATWKGSAPIASVTLRFVASLEAGALNLGLSLGRADDTPQGRWRLIQELGAEDLGAIMGTTIKSVALGGTCRLLAATGAQTDSFVNRAQTAHVNADLGQLRNADELARLALTRLARNLLSEATLERVAP